MEMDPQERDSDIGDDSPVSPNEEELSEGDADSARDHDDADSCDELRRHNSILADHGDVLAKLKMQVRDIKVGEDYDNSRHLNFPALTNRSVPVSDGFQLPVPFPFPHPAAAFLPPMAPQPAAPSSGSSHSSEGSASSQHTWSFEEQFKQVRQKYGPCIPRIPQQSLTDSTSWSLLSALYEINDDPKRKEFLDDLFSFMQKRGKTCRRCGDNVEEYPTDETACTSESLPTCFNRPGSNLGTPINRLPIMAKSVLDLYELYNLVIARGGLVDVINKKLWQEIIKGLHLPSSITSAAFTLRTQYMKYLYPYECEKRRLSTPAELQAAIDGNRREGRRSSYGQYESIQRSPNPSQMSPLSLVSQQQQLAARMNSVMSGGIGLHNGAHHPTHPQPMGQPLNGGPLPGLAPSEFEARMMEYVKLLNKEIRSNAATPPRQGDSSPPSATSPLNPLEMSRMTLWNLYNNNQPPIEPQKEALNLSEPPQQLPNTVKREPETRDSPPPAKKFVKEECDETKQLFPSTHIKINSRGDSRTGDNSLVVSMELNGITYQGVLFAQSPPGARTALAS